MKRMIEPICWGLIMVLFTVLAIHQFIKNGEVETALLTMLPGNCAMFRIALLEARQ